jgi:hypothetical protein
MLLIGDGELDVQGSRGALSVLRRSGRATAAGRV